ncbi:MAG: hypothetical protein ACK41F_09890, partial [Fimbriimonadaceae bacterium]
VDPSTDFSYTPPDDPQLGATPCLVASTDFSYTPPDDPQSAVLTQLLGVTHVGYIRNADGVTYSKKSRPPLEFGYSKKF